MANDEIRIEDVPLPDGGNVDFVLVDDEGHATVVEVKTYTPAIHSALERLRDVNERLLASVDEHLAASDAAIRRAREKQAA